jgi:diguanylate cyclase (GGDEF)-like protein
MVQHGGGDIENFDAVASIIMDDPSVLNVLIAPGGVVSRTYPHNDDLVGLNFFNEDDWAGNREAIQARDTGRLVLGGPFVIAQGVPAIVGRKPVYMTNESGEREFWGLVSIALAFPDALDRAELALLEEDGYIYELWRIDPDTGYRQVIAGSTAEFVPNTRYTESKVAIFNAEWNLRIAPTRMWYSSLENTVLIALTLISGILITLVVHKSLALRRLSATDPLTGVYNRRFFTEIASLNMSRSQRAKVEDFIFILNADSFKKVNARYGHDIGDKVLIEMTSRIQEVLRSYDVVARYGGVEFIIYASTMQYDTAYALAERLRVKISDNRFVFGDIRFSMTTSIGVAKVNYSKNIEESIKKADEMLDEAKNDGRNNVKMYREESE